MKIINFSLNRITERYIEFNQRYRYQDEHCTVVVQFTGAAPPHRAISHFASLLTMIATSELFMNERLSTK